MEEFLEHRPCADTQVDLDKITDSLCGSDKIRQEELKYFSDCLYLFTEEGKLGH